MPPLPDLVRLSKLDTQFSSEPQYIQHVQYVAGSTASQRRIRKEERWRREKRLGRGGFATVWLERCILGDNEGELRAVKDIPKNNSSFDCIRELEAIAIFSHSQVSLFLWNYLYLWFCCLITIVIKYELYFVKSFGWYDDSESIYIAMEYLPYGDLQQYLGLPLSEKEGQRIVLQILEALHFMHDIEFTHRDLKPAVCSVAPIPGASGRG